MKNNFSLFDPIFLRGFVKFRGSSKSFNSGTSPASKGLDATQNYKNIKGLSIIENKTWRALRACCGGSALTLETFFVLQIIALWGNKWQTRIVWRSYATCPKHHLSGMAIAKLYYSISIVIQNNNLLHD